MMRRKAIKDEVDSLKKDRATNKQKIAATFANIDKVI